MIGTKANVMGNVKLNQCSAEAKDRDENNGILIAM